MNMGCEKVEGLTEKVIEVIQDEKSKVRGGGATIRWVEMMKKMISPECVRDVHVKNENLV
jgi:hypothetical protein